MSLHIDKRPKTLEEFQGNAGIKESLGAILSRETDVPHTILFTGPSGCGKTTLARIAASMIGCSPNSIMEYDIANTRGIDTTREIAANAQFSPMTGKVKVYILDEVHSMTKDGQNALLKILEDTPKHVYFFLCTTDPDKLLKTIVTRCMRFEVKTLPGPVMSKLLKDTVLSEGITDFHDSVIQAIVKAADGCPRQAMILLDSVIDIIDETPALLAVAEAMATVTASIDICRLLLETTKYDKWEKMVVMLRGLQDDNAEKMRYAILRFMSGAMLKDWSDRATVQQASSVIDQFTESFMYTGKAGLVNACYNACLI